MLRKPIPSLLLAAVGCLVLSASPGGSQVIVPPTPANLLSVSVAADVTFDSVSGLYVYSYTLTNAATSEEAVWLFALEATGMIQDVSSPSGWTFVQHQDRPIVSWAATETGPLPPDYVDDGNLPPSVFTIQPGDTLTGFQLKSPDPPATVQLFAQGDTKLAQVEGDVGDLPLEGTEVPDFTQDSFTSSTAGPVPLDATSVFLGGRRPAVDGFLAFLNLADGDTRVPPVGVVVQFGVGGETVDTTTFSATLNRIDVTGLFVPNGQPDQLVAIFELGSSPLQSGRNVLITSVDGIVPGTTRTASDVDRLTFFVP